MYLLFYLVSSTELLFVWVFGPWLGFWWMGSHCWVAGMVGFRVFYLPHPGCGDNSFSSQFHGTQAACAMQTLHVCYMYIIYITMGISVLYYYFISYQI